MVRRNLGTVTPERIRQDMGGLEGFFAAIEVYNRIRLCTTIRAKVEYLAP